MALEKAVGAYAIVVMDRNNPDVLIGARKSSPLVMGIGNGEYFLASDASPIIKYTNKVIYLNDEEIVTIHSNGNYEVTNLKNEVQEHEIQELDLKIEELERRVQPLHAKRDISATHYYSREYERTYQCT